MHSVRPCLALSLLLALASPVLPAPAHKEGPVARLQRALNGEWAREGDIGIYVEIRRNATNGGNLYFHHLEKHQGRIQWRLYDKVPYRAISGDRIRLVNAGIVYQIKILPKTMEWRIPGVKGKQVWRRMHRLPGEKR